MQVVATIVTDMKFAQLWQLIIKKRLLIVPGMIILVFIVIGAGLLLKQRSSESFYYKNLSSLELDIQQISTLIEPSSGTEIKDNLTAYDGHMKQISDRCQKLTEKNIELTDEKVTKLCGDLTAVTLYSSALYDSLRNYLLIPHESFPASESADFSDRLAQTSQVINTATLNLSKIDNSKVKDPALDELKAQVEVAQKLSTGSQQAFDQKDNAEAIRLSNQLVALIVQDKQDFLSARSYFWNNTVQIAALQQSVSKLREQHGPSRASLK